MSNLHDYHDYSLVIYLLTDGRRPAAVQATVEFRAELDGTRSHEPPRFHDTRAGLMVDPADPAKECGWHTLDTSLASRSR
jgi:hypothetical protein